MSIEIILNIAAKSQDLDLQVIQCLFRDRLGCIGNDAAQGYMSVCGKHAR